MPPKESRSAARAFAPWRRESYTANSLLKTYASRVRHRHPTGQQHGLRARTAPDQQLVAGRPDLIQNAKPKEPVPCCQCAVTGRKLDRHRNTPTP